jgi:hypothetical protein
MNPDNFLTQYRQNGIVFPIPALSKLEVQQAQKAYLDLCEPGKVVVKDERRIFGHLLHPWIASLSVILLFWTRFGI